MVPKYQGKSLLHIHIDSPTQNILKIHAIRNNCSIEDLLKDSVSRLEQDAIAIATDIQKREQAQLLELLKAQQSQQELEPVPVN